MRAVLLGCPGSGKGTQSKRLSERYGFTHLATGDIFRAEIAQKTELGVKAQDYVKSGKLVPDQIVVEMVAQVEEEGQFPQADYAFDNGVLTLELTRLIESKGKHWVSELESSRHILWQDEWRRVDEVARELRQQHPKSFRKLYDQS